MKKARFRDDGLRLRFGRRTIFVSCYVLPFALFMLFQAIKVEETNTHNSPSSDTRLRALTHASFPRSSHIDRICYKKHNTLYRTKFFLPCQRIHQRPNRHAGGLSERFYEYRDHGTPKSKPFQLLAFYLPQFHPIPENDRFWGKGFTEWSNVAKAVPYFADHYQPHLPIHTGFYDLRIVENMVEQARLARNYGIDGFTFYVYWFNGRFVMDTPLRNLLKHPEINISFSLMWANENWSRRWDGLDNQILIAQNHSIGDSLKFMKSLIPYFRDERYIKIKNSPMFMVYRPQLIPRMPETIATWTKLLKRYGFDGLHNVAAQTFGLHDPTKLGFDAAVEFPPHSTVATDVSRELVAGLDPKFSGKICSYPEMVRNLYTHETRPSKYPTYPTAIMGWDNTARKGARGDVYHNFTLRHFQRYVTFNALRLLDQTSIESDARFMFVNAWNEWAEGSHLEPDRKYGFGYLEAAYQAVRDFEDVSGFYETLRVQRDPRKTGRTCPFCVIIHAANVSGTSGIIQRLKSTLVSAHLSQKFDVFVSTTSIRNAMVLHRLLPQSVITLVENRGRDALPFLQMLNTISRLNYTACLKLHSDGGQDDGDRRAADAILQSTAAFQHVLARFDNDMHLGAVVPRKLLTPFTRSNMRLNCDKVLRLWRQVDVEPDADAQLAYADKSIFWFRPAAVRRLRSINSALFEDECGFTDGEQVHAFERSFLIIVQSNGYRVDLM
jgi:lipopolysaccharide biosynthesis protein